jgi:salicylate hydroxylase
LTDRQVALVPAGRANWFVLDSLEKTLSTPGFLGEEQLTWLAKALDANSRLPALILVHHNPGKVANIDGIKDTEALFAVLRPRKNVKACFFGHTHRWNVAQDESGVTAWFFDRNGSHRRTAKGDVLIGADGIHSVVRAALFGPESPQFTGVVAYRAVVPRERLSVPNLDAFTKWWGPTSSTQIVTFPLNRGRETFIFATTPQDDWRHESWTMPGDVNELRHIYADFHPQARALLDACSEVMKSALCVRDPLPAWSVGRTTLLGDACHPMMPFMAQGAGMAVEDAIVLARMLEAVDRQGVPAALKRYEAARQERTARIQIGSRGNNWLREGGNADWVYGYDAWMVARCLSPAADIAVGQHWNA